jgi:guanylate kinase
MKRKCQPTIFLFSAPSGTGKGTLVSSVLREVDGLRRVVTVTSRPKRKGEVEGRSYHFISKEDFRELIREGAFVEWNQIYGDFYGTKKDVVERFVNEAAEKGEHLLLEIDVDGKRNFARQYRNVVSVFLLPPSMEELERRIRNRRSEPPEQMKRRLSRAEMELGRKAEYDYCVVNDSKNVAVEKIKAIIRKEIEKREKRRRGAKGHADS